MATYTKDKNIITITMNGIEGSYRLDINTGIFYGLKGNPIKTCPRKSELLDLFRNGETSLSYALYAIFSNIGNLNALPNYLKIMQGADKCDALKLVVRLNMSAYEYLNDNIRELSAWLKESNDFYYNTFYQANEENKIRKKFGSAVDLLNNDMIQKIHSYKPEITTQEIDLFIYYLVRGKFWEYHNGDISKLVKYLEICKAIEKEPQKVNNFMREYYETKHIYDLRKEEFDNKRIANNYAKHEKAWEFEYGNFKILIPTCGQDLVTEGQKMHHCVGGYVNDIVENRCYICFVRNKNNLDKPYITCQVYKNGEIGQYYLAYDRYISSKEDKEFREAFQSHLHNTWN